MRITITHDFSTAEEAAQFLARVCDPVITINHLAGKPTFTETSSEKPARKPRSDAGKPRGPYKPRETSTGEPAASEPGYTGEGIPARTPPAAPATPTTSSAPAPAAASSAPTSTQAMPVAEEFPATLDGARAAMKKLNDTPGLGMDACIASLKAHGVNRISDLPQEKFAEFIKYVLAQVSAGKK